jgi:acetate kinase
MLRHHVSRRNARRCTGAADPRDLQSLGIQRYGFHGLSCESIIYQLEASLPERLIIAHLGNRASVTAVKNGKSIDTSMGHPKRRGYDGLPKR